MNDIYFTTTSGRLVTNHDIAKAAIINGDTVDEYNLDEVRKYASTCKGIVKEINPSIKVCLQNGDKITAVKLYYYRHPGITLKDAKNVIDDMESKMKLGILKQDTHRSDIQSVETEVDSMFFVEGYDKDNDAYEVYYETEDFEKQKRSQLFWIRLQ